MVPETRTNSAQLISVGMDRTLSAFICQDAKFSIYTLLMVVDSWMKILSVCPVNCWKVIKWIWHEVIIHFICAETALN